MTDMALPSARWWMLLVASVRLSLSDSRCSPDPGELWETHFSISGGQWLVATCSNLPSSRTVWGAFDTIPQGFPGEMEPQLPMLVTDSLMHIWLAFLASLSCSLAPSLWPLGLTSK